MSFKSRQKSKMFLLPKYEFTKEVTNKCNTYCGLNSDVWDEFLYLFIKHDDIDIKTELEVINNKYYVESIETEEGVLYKLKYTESFKENVVKPFLLGKYSKIDKNYVNKYFTKYVKKDKDYELSLYHRIFNKSEVLRAYWEDLLGVSLPEDAEVYGIPLKEDEIFKE